MSSTALLFEREGRVFEGDGKKLVGADVIVAVVAIDIVQQVAILVEEGLTEGLLKEFAFLLDALCHHQVGLLSAVDEHVAEEAFGIVVERVELDDVARTRNDGAAIGLGVHPSDGFVAAVAVEQSVAVNK